MPRSLISILLSIAAIGLIAAPAQAAQETAAAIGHRATSTAQTAAAATSLAIPKPTGTAAGDVLVARVINRDKNDRQMTAPAGWSLVGSHQSAGMLKAWVFVRVAGESEPASYTFSINGSYKLAGTVSAFTGVDPVAPIDAYSHKVNGTSATLESAPTTTTAGNDRLVWFAAQLYPSADCSAGVLTPPAGLTETVDPCPRARPNGIAFSVAQGQLGAPAAGKVFTGSSPNKETNLIQVVALRPAGALSRHRATTSAHTAGTTLTIAKPAGTVPGDLLVARIANRNKPEATVKPPAGWKVVREDQTAWSVKSRIYVKSVAGSEPASYSFQFDSSLRVAGSISAFAGVDSFRPVDASSGKYNSSTTTFTTAALTTTSSRGSGLWFGTQSPNGCSQINPPPGFTETLEACRADGADSLTYNVAVRRLAAAGAQQVWTGNSPTQATNITQAVALRRALPTQAANSYGPSVDVGKLWDGTNADGSRNTTIGQDVLYQPSGIGASRISPGVIYVQSEKNRQTMVAVSTSDAKVLGKFKVTMPEVFDWEDMATGPCPAGSCVFAGDTGLANREGTRGPRFSITRVPEPNVAGGQTSGTLTGETFFFRYPDGKRFDSEALMVDPRTGQIFVVTKDGSGAGVSEVFAFPVVTPAAGSETVLTKVATLRLPTDPADPTFSQATAAAAHPSDNRFLLRTYRRVYEYRGSADGGLASAFSAAPVALTDTKEGQGEAIEYEPDGSAYYTLSERDQAPYTLKRVDRR